MPFISSYKPAIGWFGSNSTGSTVLVSTITPPVPASIPAASFMIVACSFGTQTGTPTTPTGFTKRLTVDNVAGDHRMVIYTRVCTGDANDTMGAITIGNTCQAAATCAVWRNVDTVTPILADGGFSNTAATSTAILSAAVTNPAGIAFNCGVGIFSFRNATATTIAPPASYTERVEQNGHDAGTNFELEVADLLNAPAGSTTLSATSSVTGTNKIGYCAFLNPASRNVVRVHRQAIDCASLW